MQLFDDPRYIAIRKRYDPKTYIGYGIVIPVMLANLFIESPSISMVLFILQIAGLAYVIKIGLQSRRELKALQAIRKSE